MTGESWRIRAGSPNDRELLTSFACADPAVRWQVEVEQFIQAQLLEWAFEPLAAEGDPRLLLAFTATGELLGVAAHERAILQAADRSQFHATKLEVIAVGLKWQGQQLPTGERPSDILMSAVMTETEGLAPPPKKLAPP